MTKTRHLSIKIKESSGCTISRCSLYILNIEKWHKATSTALCTRQIAVRFRPTRQCHINEDTNADSGVNYSKREGNRQPGEDDKSEGDKSKKAEFEAEKAEIKAKAEVAGTYLKAPNGKDTNLTPDEFTTVRTKSFKEFFGDWELSEKSF